MAVVLATVLVAAFTTGIVDAPTGHAAVAGAAATTQPLPGMVTPIAAFRALDTRSRVGTTTTTPVVGGATVLVPVTGSHGVPSTPLVSSVMVTLTATQSSGSGYVTAWASGSVRPTASNLNTVRSGTVANSALVPVGPDGRIALYTAVTSHLIIDVSGWIAAGSASAPGAFVPVAPFRAVDTRVTRTPLAERLTVPVTGRGGVPGAPSVAAVVLNLTATGGTQSGYLTTYSTRAGRENIVRTGSTLNYAAGQTLANLVVVPVGADGTIEVANGSYGGSVDVVVDIQGWIRIGALSSAGALRTISSIRVLDTRSALGTPQATPVPAGGRIVIKPWVSTSPDHRRVGAVILNVTAVSPTAAGFATAYATGTPQPPASNLNWSAGQNVAVLVIAPVGADGTVTLTNGSTGTTHFVVDLLGSVLRSDVEPAPGWVATSTVPLTPEFPSTGDLYPDDLACAPDGTCAVTGKMIDRTGGSAFSFLGRWNGSAFVTQGTSGNGFRHAACAGADLCAAAGDDLQVSTGSSWVRSFIPAPPGSATTRRMNAIACVAQTCLAGGFAANNVSDGPPSSALVVRYVQGKWAALPSLPFPPGTLTSTALDVACASDSDCTAVGYFRGSDGLSHPWLAHTSGSSWSLSDLSDASPDLKTLNHVACLGATGCVAVGGARDASPLSTTIALRRMGTDWQRITPAALPGNAWDLSCSTSRCTLLTHEDVTTSHLFDIVDDHVSEDPLVLSSGTGPADLRTVSCSGGGACVTGGLEGDEGLSDPGLLGARGTSGTWVIGRAPHPVGAVEPEGVNRLQVVRTSCADDFCAALKLYRTAANEQRIAFVTQPTTTAGQG